MEWYNILIYAGLLFGAWNSWQNYKLQRMWFCIMHPQNRTCKKITEKEQKRNEKEKGEKMSFGAVQEGDEVFGMVYGKGTVCNVLNGYWHFEVIYSNSQVVPYNIDGVPAWSNLNIQTVFYRDETEIEPDDILPQVSVLTPKKIIKYRNKGTLEVRCPSGIWQNVTHCPSYISEEYLENEQFHLFRKAL